MNFIEKLKHFGAEFEEYNIDMSKDSKFVLNRDIHMYHEFVYILKYNKIPSYCLIEFKKSKFDDFIKYLLSHNFKVVYTNCTYARHIKETALFHNAESRVLIEISNNDIMDDSYNDFPSAFNDDEENSIITLCYDAYHDTTMVSKIKELFQNTELSSIKHKLLLFEKDEYQNMVLTPHKIKNYDLDFSENYNDDFLEVHKKIETWIDDFSMRNNKLVLLHGVPGAGKTNYIKYILNNVGEKVKKIYIPPYFVQSLSDPAFLPIIKKEKESLIIIEDAEKILVNRDESSENSIISILLNLCDGIMADVLNFKIIATFNTDEDRIDSALKRKGRMFLKYKFDTLTKSKTQYLYNKIHNAEPPKAQMTLAEIYNDDNEFGPKKEVRRVGF